MSTKMYFTGEEEALVELRRKNYATIETYMQIRDLGRGKKRLPLFTEDGVFQLTF